MIPKINQAEYLTALEVSRDTKEALLIVGEPGIGKTYTPLKFCKDNGYNLILSHPAVNQPTDYLGLPVKSQIFRPVDLEKLLDSEESTDGVIECAKFLPFNQMLEAIMAERPTYWFFDDGGQASDSVQKALMQLFGSRELAGHKLPDCVHLLMATNGREHKAGVKGLLEPFKSRFGMILELVADLQSWRSIFAPANNIHPSILFTLEWKPDLFCKFDPNRGMEKSPNPRLWEKASKILHQLDKTGHVTGLLREKFMQGCVGEAEGSCVLTFERLSARLPNLNDIIADPENYPIDQPIDVRFALLGMLASKANDNTVDSVFRYTNKMAKEYQIVFFRMLKAVNKGMVGSDSAQRWWASNLNIFVS